MFKKTQLYIRRIMHPSKAKPGRAAQRVPMFIYDQELYYFEAQRESSGGPTAVSWVLIEQRKRYKSPLRNRLGSLAAIDLVLARCVRCSVVLGAVQCWGGSWVLYNAAHCSMLRAV